MGYTTSHGYVSVYVGPAHPMGSGAGWCYEHRLVAARMIGRHLLPGEEVHHKNGDKLDNRPENLEVVTRSEHKAIHKNLLTDSEIAELLLLGHPAYRVAKRARASTWRVSRIRRELLQTKFAPLLSIKSRWPHPIWSQR